jgi:hypothetical protein
LLLGFQVASAQTWTQTSALNRATWKAITSSADGSRLAAAVVGGGIWVSTNSGATWTVTSAPNTNLWWDVAASADGTKLAAAEFNYGVIYSSENGGATWIRDNVPNWEWSSIAMSADGTKLVASAASPARSEYIFTSVDSGATWTSNGIPATSAVYVACPANGSKLVAAVNAPGQIFSSTNMGAGWEPVNFPFPNVGLLSVASSAGGSAWVVGGAGGSLYVTTNSGTTWVSNGVEYANISSCASSADGSTLVAVAASSDVGIGGGLIFTSTNFGVTWTQADAPADSWRGVASSADGCRLAGSASFGSAPLGHVWSGGIWAAQTAPAPRLKIAPVNGNRVLSWIIPSTNFVLQQNLDLNTPNWSDVTNPPVLNLTNLEEQVTLPATNGSVFYRLATQ